MTKKKKLLLQFLREWDAWREGGAKHHAIFSGHYGLCNNFSEWIFENSEFSHAAKLLLTALLTEIHGRYVGFPFNDDISYFDYKGPGEEEGRHMNPRRIAWVKATIAKLEREINV